MENLPKYIKIEYVGMANSFHEWEICYWRKCYSLREMILEVLPCEKNKYVYELSAKRLKDIRDVIYEQLTDPDGWRSIWDFDEVISSLAQHIVNITWLIGFLKEHPNVAVYFYDSY